MNKNIIVTMIAGAFFAAGVVGPATADNLGFSDSDLAKIKAAAPKVSAQQNLPKIDLGDGLPDIKIDDRTGVADKIREKLKELDLDGVTDIEDLAKVPELDPRELPDLNPRPELDPIEPVAEVPAVDPIEVPELEVADASEVRVKDIVANTRAEKATILAAYGGDRRAAKGELKAAQMRMVERIKTRAGKPDKGAKMVRGTEGKKAKKGERGKKDRDKR